MFSRRHLPFQVFCLAFVAAMFFPRVLPEGMFPDGLTYASIARNMAEGRGGFWSPYFSSSFWIPFKGSQYAFYGHPTLAMGLQSLLFRLIGDHWFVEKLYNILIWLITVGLVIRLWQQNGREHSLWWLPVFTWYLMPTVLWSYPNFILDNSMAVFSLTASFWILKNCQNLPLLPSKEPYGQYKTDFLAQWTAILVPSLLLHLAFLTKGPVGLFPLAIPFIHAWVYTPKAKSFSLSLRLLNGFKQSLALTLVCLGSLSLWYFYEPARLFWLKYFQTQLMSSIGETDQTEEYTWLAYLYIPQQILIQALALCFVGLVLWAFSKGRKAAFFFEKEANQKALFFGLVFLSGSLPMLISHKASDYFLLPALPFLVLSFSVWIEPTLSIWLETYKLNPQKSWIVNRCVAFLAVAVLLYSAAQIGRVGREREILNDMAILSAGGASKQAKGFEIPNASKICVCDSMMKHFNYHGYFQRYHRWELTKPSDTTAPFFIDETGICRPTELDSAIHVWGFRRVEISGLQTFRVYQRD